MVLVCPNNILCTTINIESWRWYLANFGELKFHPSNQFFKFHILGQGSLCQLMAGTHFLISHWNESEWRAQNVPFWHKDAIWHNVLIVPSSCRNLHKIMGKLSCIPHNTIVSQGEIYNEDNGLPNEHPQQRQFFWCRRALISGPIKEDNGHSRASVQNNSFILWQNPRVRPIYMHTQKNNPKLAYVYLGDGKSSANIVPMNEIENTRCFSFGVPARLEGKQNPHLSLQNSILPGLLLW